MTAVGDPVWAGAILPGYPADEETGLVRPRLVTTLLESEKERCDMQCTHIWSIITGNETIKAWDITCAKLEQRPAVRRAMAAAVIGLAAWGTHLRRDTVIPQWFQASKAAAASDGHAVHC